jgi:hypothetical protein
MPHARAISHFPKIDSGVRKPVPHKFHSIHVATLRQNLAHCKRQDLPADERQNIAMPLDYRAALRKNLKALLEAHKLTRLTLRATYLAGPKKGRLVSPRAIGYMLSADPAAPSPSLDVLAAVATAFDLQPWHLLVPGLDPNNPPVTQLTPEERKLYADYQRLRAQLTRNNSHS